MRKQRKSFLENLLSAHGTSGYETEVREVWKSRVSKFADSVRTDVLGNSFATLNPEGHPRVLLAGHADEIGFQVTHIDEWGYLSFRTVGGHDVSMVPGRRVLVHTRRGKIPGVTGKPAVHLLSPEERKRVPEVHEIWIDIGAKNKEEAASLVRIGDSVTHDIGCQELRNGLLTSRALDDRAGAFVVAEVLSVLSSSRKQLHACVIAVATVQEEIGTRGAVPASYGVSPDVGICVDVTHATDSPGIDQRKVGEVRLGAGPRLARGACISPKVFERLEKIARQKKIPYQTGAIPGAAPNDARSIQLAREGVATGVVGIPLRYMHTPSEVVSLEDLDSSISLLSDFCLSLNSKIDWTP